MKILILALNAKNIHKAIAPYYIANAVKSQLDIDIDVLESNINVSTIDIVAKVLSYDADVVGLSCYIWNIDMMTHIATTIRKVRPSTIVVMGGAEIVDDRYSQLAHCSIKGAGENAWCDCIRLLQQGKSLPIFMEGKVDFGKCNTATNDRYYQSFASDDIASIEHRLVYYESSRGCPYSCAYCMSSVSGQLQFLPMDRVQRELQQLVDSGAKIIKLVDRTFNADKDRAKQIWRLVQGYPDNITFHMEISADLVDEETVDILSSMPAGKVQLEIGIQSINQDTLSAINRHTSTATTLANISKLTERTNCLVYVDLIAGLPCETLTSFMDGVEHALWTKPYALHLGFLKVLNGTKIKEMADSYCQYMTSAPYEVLYTDKMSLSDMQYLKTVESIIDKYYNTHQYTNSLELAISHFGGYIGWLNNMSQFLAGRSLKVSLKNSYGIMYDFLCQHLPVEVVQHVVKLDVLSCDAKGMLPDSIPSCRNKQLEREYNKQYPHCRIEYFPYTDTTILFDYTRKNIMNKHYQYQTIL